MAEKAPITFSLYGFVNAQESVMHAAFAHADQWARPWKLTKNLADARVIFVNLTSESEYEYLESLEQDYPLTEIVAFSSTRPLKAKWHLVRQPNGKASALGLSQLVLKIAHSLKNDLKKNSQPNAGLITSVEETKITTPSELTSILVDEGGVDPESNDIQPFFNSLDSLLDSKPNSKRKRFNES
jgi:hypothetical protein